MSVPPDFFRTEAVQGVLSRAARAAGVPVSVHFVMNGHEGPLLVGAGGCAACRYLSGTSGGKAACRASRSAVSHVALSQVRPVSEVCHLGFGMLAFPALPGEEFAVVFGPFLPVGGDASVEHDALEGLADLTGERLSRFPVPLDDIHRVAPGSLPAMADWVGEELRRLWETWSAAAPEPPAPGEAPVSRQDTRGSARIGDAQALATAVAGGNRRRVRAQLIAALEEMPKRGRGTRLLALLGETIATCGHAGVNTAPAVGLLPDAARALPKLSDTGAQADCGLRVLAAMMRQPEKHLSPALLRYRALDRILCESQPEGVSLAEAATRVGRSSAAVSLHLMRHFGMNFSEYQGRIRIERAKELLRRTKLSATVIGFRVGIDDQSNFGKLFRRHTGMSPLAYRAAYGKGRR